MFEVIIEDGLSIEEINARIRQEICHTTIDHLTDANLMYEYKKCPSVKNQIIQLENILKKFIEDNEIIKQIIHEYLPQLVPPGTKGAIRGNKFNKIIQNYITSLDLNKNNPDRFEIQFEKKCIQHITDEIPDWYILEKSTNKIIIGMNQLDLTSGGHQVNRGYKYLIDNKHNHLHSKLLCVICNEIQIKNKTNKAYKLFETGFTNNTLCYLNNLNNIINLFFN